jgi:PAS domain S-box-containing protein
MPQGGFEQRKGVFVFLAALLLIPIICIGVASGYFIAKGINTVYILPFVLLPLGLFGVYLLYKKTILPSYRSLEDANLELHLKQEELLDVKDDLFIKFLGVYDVNFAANSPRIFEDRLMDVADITARVMEANGCFIFLFDRKKDDLVLSASNGIQKDAIGKVRIPLGDGIEGWVGRRLEPLMLKDFRADSRFREIPALWLAGYVSVYCLPLYVYSNGALVGVMEVFYDKAKTFSDEEINFFTTLSGILSTTIQNEQMQSELRKMNIELEQWVAEKSEELRASEERYRTLVENACESIFLLARNGDILFANEQAVKLTKHEKYDLLHKNLFELFVGTENLREIMSDVSKGHQAVRQGELGCADGRVVPVEVSGVRLSLMGKQFVQVVVRDISARVNLEQLLLTKEREIVELKAHLGSGG